MRSFHHQVIIAGGGPDGHVAWVGDGSSDAELDRALETWCVERSDHA